MKALAAACAAMCMAGLTQAQAQTVREWNFDALLDGKPIGTHSFTVTTEGDRTTVRSVARFDVKLLGITVYRYRHEATEQWRGGCLQGLRARTDDDGDKPVVDAEVAGNALRVTTSKGSSTYPGCVMSFAYWNPVILKQERLLNAQTGEYTAVQVAALPDQPVTARGASVPAQRWRLTGPDQPLELWYGADGEWLALESTVSGGRKLRYRLR